MTTTGNPSASAAKKSQMPEEKGAALLVALGIFLSRISGLIRERAFAHYFGNSMASDAFKAALRIPNFLQNLLGEGVLSASLIPVYAKLNAEGKVKEADEVVRVVGTLLALLSTALCTLGILVAPYLTAFVAPGFTGEKAALTTELVKIFFPGIGLLVMSAWCLGILNSHHKFFLSYAAPVLWNGAIIAATLYFGPRLSQEELVRRVGWGLVVGCAAQFLVQVPTVASLLLSHRPSLNYRLKNVQTVFKNFVPVSLARGVVQLSAWIDSMIASKLPEGAVSNISYAQTIYLLPVSLFGMAVSASELPQMSRALGDHAEISAYLKTRLERSLKQISFFVVPTSLAFLVLGDYIVGLLFQSGAFDHNATVLVWATLAGSSIGLIAGTQGRLLASAFYSLKDTRTPFYTSFVRVLITGVSGLILGLWLPKVSGIDPKWGPAGLTAGFGMAAWVEFLLLKSKLAKLIGKIPFDFSHWLKLWSAAVAAALASGMIRYFFEEQRLFFKGPLALVVFALFYVAITYAFKVPESISLLQRIKRVLPLS